MCRAKADSRCFPSMPKATGGATACMVRALRIAHGAVHRGGLPPSSQQTDSPARLRRPGRAAARSPVGLITDWRALVQDIRDYVVHIRGQDAAAKKVRCRGPSDFPLRWQHWLSSAVLIPASSFPQPQSVSRNSRRMSLHLGPLPQVFLVGTSMGGALAFATSRLNPGLVEGVVFLAPMLRISESAKPPQWQVRFPPGAKLHQSHLLLSAVQSLRTAARRRTGGNSSQLSAAL